MPRTHTPGHKEVTPVTHVEIAAFSGSLRAASFARSFLRSTVAHLPSDVDLTIWEGLGDVPLFNEDLEGGPVPPAVADMRARIGRADALLIVTPEYNQGVPGVLKNALDWASRPYGQSVITGKPVAVLGTSPLPTGAASALADVVRVVTALKAEIVDAELVIPAVHTRFDEEGEIADTELAARIRRLFDNVVRVVKDAAEADELPASA